MKTATPEAHRLFHEGALTFSKLEHNGIRVDTEHLVANIDKVGGLISDTEKNLRNDDIYKLWRRRKGDKLNMGSYEQLGDLLFSPTKEGGLGYKPMGFTTSGRAKADKAVLELVDVEFVQNWLRMQKLIKLKSSFLEGVRREAVDGFLHPMFNLNTARTYRSSSDRPNFQNFPVRDEEQAEYIRSCFIPRKGRYIVEIDFSGIEVRVAACYHKDPTMIAYIKDPTKDMHRDMAAQIYCIKPEQVSKKARYAAKNQYVFPQFYGDWYLSCARNLWASLDRLGLKLGPDNAGKPLKAVLARQGITEVGRLDPKEKPRPGTFEHHLKEVEDDFWNRRFQVYGAWKKKWYDAYCKKGWFHTLTGFTIAGVLGRNDVINYPVQGSAFHCLLWSLIKLQAWLEKYKMKSLLVGQIHDSIVADVAADELEDFLAAAKHIMTVSLRKAWKWIIVPLDVEAEVSPLDGNWFQKKKVEV